MDDAPMGPKEPRSSVLSKEEEALAAAFRCHRSLPLDDCRYALQDMTPHLSRSLFHRLFQRHEISRLSGIQGGKPKTQFKTYPIGYFQTDIAEVWFGEGRPYMLVANDRTSVPI
ncbi:MAG: hypothetical protein AB8B85_20340 [Paracoccaceae bacterium]